MHSTPNFGSRKGWPRVFRAAVGLIVLGVSAGCGGSADGPSGVAVTAVDPPAGSCVAGAPDCDDTPDAPSATPPPDDPGDGEFPVTPEPSVSDPDGDVAVSTPHPWTELRDDGDGLDTTFLLAFLAGPEPCSTVDRVDVVENDFVVSITLFVGPAAGSEDVACPDFLQARAVPVTLGAPVGQRVVDDPAAGDPQPG